jgi:hypothetical protein
MVAARAAAASRATNASTMRGWMSTKRCELCRVDQKLRVITPLILSRPKLASSAWLCPRATTASWKR